MASLTIPSSPNSFQLRFGSKYRKSSPGYYRTHVRMTSRRIHLICAVGNAAKDGDGSKKSSPGNSWINFDFSGDSLSGWFSADSGEAKQRKRSFRGFVGAGVAGVVLAAGLTFASLSLSKRNASGLKEQMEPSTVQQEILVASEEHKEKIEEVGNEGNNVSPLEENLQENNSLETKAAMNKDSPPLADDTQSHYESELDVNNNGATSLMQNVISDSSGTDAINNNASSQEDSQFIPEPAADISESTIEVKEGLVANPSVFDADSRDHYGYHQEGIPVSGVLEDSVIPLDFSSDNGVQISHDPLALNDPVTSELNSNPQVDSKDVMGSVTSLSTKEDFDLSEKPNLTSEGIDQPLEVEAVSANGSWEKTSMPVLVDPFENVPDTYGNSGIDKDRSLLDSPRPDNFFSSAGIPAPSLVSASLQVLPGKVLVPAVVDQIQGQALAALQALKVIEADVEPVELCSRREYARWLVSASSVLSRNTISKVYPAMYIENITELAFDDITPQDPDFASIQGLAEAGLISSKLSRRDMLSSLDEEQNSFYFSPESPLSRQDLVSWKMALDKRQLPDIDRKITYQRTGFIDIDKIDPNAWPALVADIAAGEQGIIAVAFGYTRLFQPDKPVTKAQAAIALASGEAADIVSEELARIEAESMAETAVEAHSALVAQVEKDVNANFKKELAMEREKIDAIEKLAEEAKSELEKLRAEREEENNTLLKEKAIVESEMEILSRLRREVEEQLQSLMSDKIEVSFEREKINKLRKEAESENQAIATLQYELEVERKALSMARTWAEDQAKRATEQAKALEEARDRWERHGIKVVVDNDLREDASTALTWVDSGKPSLVNETIEQGENLVGKLKAMAGEVRGKSKAVIEIIIEKIVSFISVLKEWIAMAATQTVEFQEAAVSKVRESVQEIQQGGAEFCVIVKEGTKRVVGDCREGVERLTQKFKT